jgi:hypothetical protein
MAARALRLGLLTAVLGALAACDNVGSQSLPSQPDQAVQTPTVAAVTATVVPATAPPSTPQPTQVPPTALPNASCLLAPVDTAKDTRIQVYGTVLGTSNWTEAGQQASGPPAFPIPSDDTSTICRGVVGQSTYEVLDHAYVNGTGTAACGALTSSAYPPTQ